MYTSTLITSIFFILSLPKLYKAVDSDNCAINFRARDINSARDVMEIATSWLPGSLASADIRYKTRDGDTESTSEVIWAGHNNYNDEDIDGDYNLKVIEIDFHIISDLKDNTGSYLEYVTVECGHEINPSGWFKVTDWDILRSKHWQIWTGAFRCGQDQDCLKYQIGHWS
mmetsp:Transcript_45019/g.40272  ORF Transcript_45019/g.40272 Transcript_45019/m.40272 type:complete len:170 (+) Transcript_45019:115-624(+)